MPNAVLLLSGGMDSCALLAKALDMGYNVTTISFDYGSKHNQVEIEAAKQIAKHYNVHHDVVTLPQIFKNSALVDAPLPHGRSQQEMEDAGIAPSYVPMRNTVLLGIAGAIADSIGISPISVWYGAHADDHVGYPDCRPEWAYAMGSAMIIGSRNKVTLTYPWIWMTKAEIVTESARLLAPLHLTHSCYEGLRPACGTCDTCTNRIIAFKEAGWIDPIKYGVEVEWPSHIQPFPRIGRD